jgi:hypothetical protein
MALSIGNPTLLCLREANAHNAAPVPNLSRRLYAEVAGWPSETTWIRDRFVKRYLTDPIA